MINNNLLLALFLSFSLKTFSQVAPTLSQLTGNSPTYDYKGYVYNFGSDPIYNCYSNGSSFDQFDNPEYSYSFVDNTYLRVNFTGNQSGVMTNTFNYGNCNLVSVLSPEGLIDLSDENNQFIEARVRSSVTISSFGIYIGLVDDNGFYQIGNGVGNETKTLIANTWTVLRFPAIFADDNGITYDPARVIGFALYANSTLGSQPTGYIDIDYLRFGVAAAKPNNAGILNPNGNGFEFNFTRDSLFTCFNNMNVTGNANFGFSVDETNKYALLTQQDGTVPNDIFGMNFTDPNCYLNQINLSDSGSRDLAIRIKSDVDVPSFAVVIGAKNLNTQSLEYSRVLSTYSLLAGVWTDLSIPVSVKTESGALLDSSKVEGVYFITNPVSNINRGSVTLTGGEVNFSLASIKIGERIVTSIKNNSTINNENYFVIYPNPTTSGLSKIVLNDDAFSYRILVTDLSGRNLFSAVGESSDFILDLSSFEKGVYNVSIITEKGIMTKKIVTY